MSCKDNHGRLPGDLCSHGSKTGNNGSIGIFSAKPAADIRRNNPDLCLRSSQNTRDRVSGLEWTLVGAYYHHPATVFGNRHRSFGFEIGVILGTCLIGSFNDDIAPLKCLLSVTFPHLDTFRRALVVNFKITCQRFFGFKNGWQFLVLNFQGICPGPCRRFIPRHHQSHWIPDISCLIGRKKRLVIKIIANLVFPRYLIAGYHRLNAWNT